MSGCRPLLNCYEQADPQLVTLVQELLHPPSTQQYNLTQTGGLDTFYSLLAGDKEDLSLEMEETYLKNVKNGFFIEAGASEGRLKIHEHFLLGEYVVRYPL